MSRTAAATLLLLAVACGPSATAPPEPPVPPAADAANVDEASIYEVDEEDPYLIFNGTFFDVAPGQAMSLVTDRLREGKLKTGEGKSVAYFIDGEDDEELGYLLPDPSDEFKVGDITITSPRAITQEGARVGNTYGELIERLGPLAVDESETGRGTLAIYDGLLYRLDEVHDTSERSRDAVPDDAEIIAIIIPRK